MLFKDKKHNIIFMALVIAIVFGIYAQSITYYITENIVDLPLSLVIVVITFISLALFIIPATMVSKANKKSGETNKIDKIYLILNAIIGIPLSAFSIFVMLMWMG